MAVLPDTRNRAADAGAAARGELWGDYWADAGLHGCTEQFPLDVRQQIAARWQHLFAALRSGDTLLDIGCGRGAVLSAARDAGALARGATAIGIDLAPTVAGEGFEIRGGIDASALPFNHRSFTLVTSQFGIEYAGLDGALDEAMRVAVRAIILLTHAAEGIVAQHSGEQATQAATLIDDTRLAARLHVAIRAGGDPAPFDAILADIAALVPGASNHGLLEQIYGSVAELRRMVHGVNLADLIAAVDFMVAQLGRHQARMHALASAAPARARIDDAADRLRTAGFAAEVREHRSLRGDLVGYWLEASRVDQR